MISPLDTHITYFGSAANVAVLEALGKLRGAGYDIIAAMHDPRDAPFLRAAGIPFVRDRVEALADAQIVLTAMPAPPQVEGLYLGEQGLLELVEPGSYLVDLSVSTPQLAREIHAMASVSDIYAVDAPLVNLGEKEQSIIYVGGDKEPLEDLMPLFPYMAQTVCPQGDAGEGQFASMIAHITLAGSLMGAIEAMAMARIAGYSDTSALNAIAASAGGSRALVDYIPRTLVHDYTGRIKVGEFLDALGVALDAADQLDVTLPMVETAYQLYDLLSVVGGDELNVHSLALLYEDEQTCASFGLDWRLADELQAEAEARAGAEYIEDILRENLGQRAQGELPSEDGDDDDNPFDGYPPIGGFFSKN